MFRYSIARLLGLKDLSSSLEWCEEMRMDSGGRTAAGKQELGCDFLEHSSQDTDYTSRRLTNETF